MSIFGDNVAKLRAREGLSQRALASRLGVSKGTVGTWETKDTLPNMETLEKVASFFDAPVWDLFGLQIEARDKEEFSSQELRVYGRIAAGTPLEMEQGDYGFPCPTYILKQHPKAFYLEVDGESMSRVLPNGCLVLVDPMLKEPVINGKVYALCINGYDATVKRVRQLANGVELIPDSLDPTYRPQVFDNGVEGTESITIIGRVVWYIVPFDFDI